MNRRPSATYRLVASPFLLSLAVLPLAAFDASADSDPTQWRYCLPAPRISAPPIPLSDDRTTFTADHAEGEINRYSLQGNVLGQRGAESLFADQINYDTATGRAQAEGNVRYRSGDRLLHSTQATIVMDRQTGELTNTRFRLQERHLRGTADRLHLEGSALMRLQDTQFTTCDEGNEFWRIKASSLQLDQTNNVGIARHLRLEIKSVPVLYSPYLSFPLKNQRKTGLLFPSIGSSSRSGSEISVPLYVNIAADKDATLNARYMSKRGMMWGGEYRYLNARSKGDLSLSYLPGDNVFGDNRGGIAFRHSGDPAEGWRTNLQYRRVTDGEYLQDFGNLLNTTSLTHLESRADLSYQNTYWNGSLLVQNYQTLDDSQPADSRPYARVPQIKLGMQPLRLASGLELNARGELVGFSRETGVIGRRLDIQPDISLPISSSAGFITPRLGFRHTSYALQRTASNSNTKPSRNLPLLSLDSGLFFERELTTPTGTGLQTLEPRLFYLYVPYVDQSELIVDEAGASQVFDASLPLFSYGQMFRNNRFNGADRVGDANQLSAALSSRYLDARGVERGKATLGRVFYFRDRKVTLPGEAVATETASNWLGAVRANLTTALAGRLNLEWDQEKTNVERGNASLRYHPSKRSALNLGYRFERDRLEQTDISLMWPLWRGISVLGRHRYSLQDKVLLESVLGAEYDSCCWVIRGLLRRYRIQSEEALNSTFWIQLELKGLSSVGQNVAALLERDILAR